MGDRVPQPNAALYGRENKEDKDDGEMQGVQGGEEV